MKVDVISDIHIDSHISFGEVAVKNFVKHITKKKKSKILILAGDLANSNRFSKGLLTELSNIYEQVVVVFGNHDLYMPGFLHEVYPNKMTRWLHLKQEVRSLKNVHFLEGEVIELDGLKIGGTGAWYDWSYSIKHLGKSISEIEATYQQEMYDSTYIAGLDQIDWDFAAKEKKKLSKIAAEVDIMVTHVAPMTDMITEDFKEDVLSGAFSFNGKHIVKKTTAKVWIFGHTHTKQDFEREGVRFVNNAFGGYNPDGSYEMLEGVKTIEIKMADSLK